MKLVYFPEKESWETLYNRQGIDKNDLTDVVRSIINGVKSETDKAIYYYAKKFDGISPGELKVSSTEIKESTGHIPKELKNAIKIAKKNIEDFHSVQLHTEPVVETVKGVKCWRKSVAIEKVGLYIP